MAESDSPVLGAARSEAEIEQCLLRVVRDALKNDEDITTNQARSRAETELGLDAGFLKDDPEWKQRSKSIINAATEEPESPAVPRKESPPSRKRKSAAADPVKKRKKPAKADSSDDLSELSGGSDDNKPDRDRPRQRATETSNTRLGLPPDIAKEQSSKPEKADPADAEADRKPDVDSESELSSLIDDPPPKKKAPKKAASSETKRKPKSSTAKSTQARSSGKELSSDEEEIKRLQGWLLKCGIRKLWHRELAPYSTATEKIQHLRKMLSDAGMTGRYSVEKARQIKEARELADEIEAAKDFNEQWGHGELEKSDDDDDRDGESDGPGSKLAMRPRQALPKGLIDFGDSGDDSG